MPHDHTKLLLDDFKARLKGQGSPCLMMWDKESSGPQKSGPIDLREDILSASALWNRSLEKRHLLRRMGLRPGDIWLDKGRGSQQLINFLACLSGDFIFCPHRLPEAQGDSLQKVQVAWDAAEANAQGSTPGSIEREKIQISSRLLTDQEFAVFLHTSGTSRGTVRTVKLTASMIRHQLKEHSSIFGLKADTNRLVFLPGFHSFGLILDRLLGLYAGQNLIFYPDQFFHPRLLLSLVRDFQIDWIALVPRTLQLLDQYLKRSPCDPSLLGQLHIHSGGAYLDPAQRTLWHKRLGSFWWGYGLTECGPGVMINGRPIGCSVRLVPVKESSLQERVCEIWVKSPSMGSWQDERKGVESNLHEDLRDKGYYPTGDLGWQTDDGLIEVIGRRGESFKSTTGQWTHLREVESHLVKDLGLEAAHLCLGSSGKGFQLRILVNEDVAGRLQQVSTAIKNRLRSWLPLPCEVIVFKSSPELFQKIGNIPRKSLSEALLLLDKL